MMHKFFVGLTTEPAGGLFLVIGQEVQQDFTLAFLVPEQYKDDVSWGHVIDVDLSGPKKIIEGDMFPCVHYKGRIDHPLDRNQAQALQDKVSEFLLEKGWTEEREGDLDEEFATHNAYFSIFPDQSPQR